MGCRNVQGARIDLSQLRHVSALIFVLVFVDMRLSPFFMAFTCEAMRICFRFGKKMRGQEPVYTVLKQEQSELSDSSSDGPRKTTTSGSPSSFLAALFLYNAFCASTVAFAIWNGWLETGGAGLAWELWVLWQQLCLWDMFFQNLVRCVQKDP